MLYRISPSSRKRADSSFLSVCYTAGSKKPSLSLAGSSHMSREMTKLWSKIVGGKIKHK